MALDAGRGDPALAGARDIFLTHGHLDHSLGVPFAVSLRTLAGESTRIVCPRPIASQVEDLLAAAARLEDAEYRCEVLGVVPGDRLAVGKDLTVEAFPVEHRVPSLGYHLLRARRRLLPELRNQPAEAIVARRRSGEEVERAEDELWLSYAGDTGAGVFDLEPRLFDSRVLMLECTFLGDGHRDRAARYGHLHVEDLRPLAERSRNEAIVLHHLSRRYRAGELEREIAAKLPEIAARVRVLGAD